MSKNEYVNYEDNIIELGGFAENPDDVEGNYEVFNRGLASDYLVAMISEDFLALGELSRYLLETIYFWEKPSKILKNDFLNGNFKTYKNRTFIEAITKTHAYQAGEAYLHVNNPKFLAMMIAYSELYEYTLGYQYHEDLDSNQWNKLIQETLNELSIIYDSISDEEKIILLKRVKKTLPNITAPKDFGACKLPSNSLTRQLKKD